MSHTVQVISDVHLDVRGGPMQIKATAPTLIIAGDVAPFIHPKYRDYLGEITMNHRNVAYVAGNHEYYESPLSPMQSQEQMERVCNSLPSNVVFLRAGGGHLDIPRTDLRVVGATMWTNIDPSISGELERLLNDFTHIRISPQTFISGHDMSVMHEIDKRWVADSVSHARRDGKRSVVVTHHSPDRRLSVNNDARAKSGYGPLYYASDMGGVFSVPGIAAWASGHTHESHVMWLPNVKFPFITNAHGYPGEKTGFASGSGLNLSKKS